MLSSRGLDGNRNNKLRRKLSDQGLKMLVVKNSLARRATASSKLKGFESLLDGPSAIVYATQDVAVSAIARLLVDAKKDDDKTPASERYFDFRIPGSAFRTTMNERSYLTFGVPRWIVDHQRGIARKGPIEEIRHRDARGNGRVGPAPHPDPRGPWVRRHHYFPQGVGC